MPDNSRRLLPTCRSVIAAIGIALAAHFTGTPNVASAHSFVVTLDATAAAEPFKLTSAIQGMRVPASERDSHAAETSDGHLGGIDLFIRAHPADAAEGITWLKGYAAYDNAPDRQAAQGYNAALRKDRAIRDSGGVHDIEALQEALGQSSGGIDWP